MTVMVNSPVCHEVTSSPVMVLYCFCIIAIKYATTDNFVMFIIGSKTNTKLSSLEYY